MAVDPLGFPLFALWAPAGMTRPGLWVPRCASARLVARAPVLQQAAQAGRI